MSTFPDEASARSYLESRLWPEGIRCPECKSGERTSSGLLEACKTLKVKLKLIENYGSI